MTTDSEKKRHFSARVRLAPLQIIPTKRFYRFLWFNQKISLHLQCIPVGGYVFLFLGDKVLYYLTEKSGKFKTVGNKYESPRLSRI